MSDVDDGIECEAAAAAAAAAAGVPDATLGDAVRALRAAVPVRDAWRDALLREAAALPAPRAESDASPRRPTLAARVAGALARPVWVLSPATGIAAALLCAALGAGGAWELLRRRADDVREPASLAATTSAPPTGWAVPGVRFALLAPGASRVALVGDFNGWNPAATPLRESADGHTWSVSVPLAPGRHVYAFVVDGSVTADPAAPRAAEEDFGTPSSVVLVAETSP